MAARLVLATKWNVQPLKTGKDKMIEYAMMAKLTSYINKRSIQESEKKQGTYYAYHGPR